MTITKIIFGAALGLFLTFGSAAYSNDLADNRTALAESGANGIFTEVTDPASVQVVVLYAEMKLGPAPEDFKAQVKVIGIYHEVGSEQFVIGFFTEGGEKGLVALPFSAEDYEKLINSLRGV